MSRGTTLFRLKLDALHAITGQPEMIYFISLKGRFHKAYLITSTNRYLSIKISFITYPYQRFNVLFLYHSLVGLSIISSCSTTSAVSDSSLFSTIAALDTTSFSPTLINLTP